MNDTEKNIIILQEQTKSQEEKIKKLEANIISMKKDFSQDIKDLKTQNNKGMWFTISTLVGVVVTLVTLLAK